MEVCMINEKMYRMCCENCIYFAGEECEEGKTNCTSNDKKKEYDESGRVLRRYFPSTAACKHFEISVNASEYIPKRHTQIIVKEQHFGYDNNILSADISKKISCIHRSGNRDSLSYNQLLKKCKCNLCSATFFAIEEDELESASKDNSTKYDVLESLKIMCYRDKDLLEKVKALLIKYHVGEDISIESDLIKDCIYSFNKEVVDSFSTRNISKPERRSYFKGYSKSGRIIGYKRLNNQQSNLSSSSRPSNINSTYVITNLSNGHIAYCNNISLDRDNVVEFIEISEEEYNLLNNIINLSNEFFMHDYMGAFPRDESVKEYMRHIEINSKKLLSQYLGE